MVIFKGISSTYVTCICPMGYIGNGLGSLGCVKSSQPVNACEPNPCVNGLCKIIETGNFICACTGNYTGRICDRTVTNICDQNPCRNGGTCVMDKTNFICQCLENFKGLLCESELECKLKFHYVYFIGLIAFLSNSRSQYFFQTTSF